MELIQWERTGAFMLGSKIASEVYWILSEHDNLHCYMSRISFYNEYITL